MKFSIIMMLLTALMFFGCATGHNITPLRDNRYEIRVKSKSFSVLPPTAQESRLKEKASEICKDFYIQSTDSMTNTLLWRYRVTMESWIISCVEKPEPPKPLRGSFTFAEAVDFPAAIMGSTSARISYVQTGQGRYEMFSGSSGPKRVDVATSEFHKKATEVCHGDYDFVKEWEGDSQNSDWLGWSSYYMLSGTVRCKSSS